ncbi:hypothetical protein EV359DRAFT_85414 [Lentinula novae-zelandiae]|nr:hypothetical protein EV359DRAFT_85414 [Lentinula novae-zelandiae]
MTRHIQVLSCSRASYVSYSGSIENLDHTDRVSSESTRINTKASTKVLPHFATLKENLSATDTHSYPSQTPSFWTSESTPLGTGTAFESTNAMERRPRCPSDSLHCSPPYAAVTMQRDTPRSIVPWISNVGKNPQRNVRVGNQEPRGSMADIVGETSANQDNRTMIRSRSEDIIKGHDARTPAKTSIDSPKPLLFYVRKAQERIKAQKPTRWRPKGYESLVGEVNETGSCCITPVKEHKVVERVVKTEWPPRAPSPSLLPDPAEVFGTSGSKGKIYAEFSPSSYLQSCGPATENRVIPPSNRRKESIIVPKLDIMSSDLTKFLQCEHASLLQRYRNSSEWFPDVAESDQDTDYASAGLKGIDILTLGDAMTADRPRRRTACASDVTVPEVKCPRPVRAHSFLSVEGQLLQFNAGFE